MSYEYFNFVLGIGRISTIKIKLEKVCKVSVLDLNITDAAPFYKLKATHHKDPFDRMLVWQAIQNNLVFITDDERIHKYRDCGLKVLW